MDRLKKFLEKSIKIHGDIYDYSLVEYINAKTKVKIICKKHGVFEQDPDNHSRGSGCKFCKGGAVLGRDKFIENSKIKHGDLYDYSGVIYVNNRKKVNIICKRHGLFKQSPSEHVFGYGCHKCGKEKVAVIKNELAKNTFFEKANKIHEYKYDYSKSEYINSRSKMTIICKKHGEFIQNCNSHLMGNGCPSCRESAGEKKIRGFLEINNIKFIPQKRFIDCKHVRSLPFDFYVEEYNMCIEYDGIQHYKEGGFHKNKDSFELTKKKDKIKSEYCLGKNGRPSLIRISYKQYEEIENIMKSLFA
jgi:hypothetical protein